MNQQRTIKQNRLQILRLSEQYGAGDVRLFGSAGRGDLDEKSDIDLLIAPKPGMTLLQHNAFRRELEELLGCPVDLVSDRALRPGVKERVLIEAIPL